MGVAPESPPKVPLLGSRAFVGCRYNASDGTNSDSNQPSGAYIFRPNSSTPVLISKTAQTESVQVETRDSSRVVLTAS